MSFRMSGSGNGKEGSGRAHRTRRFVLRFDRGGVHSFDVLEGEDPVEVLRCHLAFFPDRTPETLQEQFYDPAYPRRFRYEERGELLNAVKGLLASEEEGEASHGLAEAANL
jgi:hypothetical protein